MFIKLLMDFEIFMSKIKYFWIFQKIMYFPSQFSVFWNINFFKLQFFIDNIINVEGAKVLQ